MKQTFKQFIAVLLILLAASSLALALYHWDNKYTKPGAQPIAGILFVNETDWQETPLRFLWNGWLFCPDRLLTPAEANTLDTTSLVSLIIGEHNNFSFANETHSPQGCGTYLLTLELPETPHTYAIELPEIFSAYCFYVNEELLVQMGNPYEDAYEALIQNRMVTFTASGTTQLLLAVRDEDYIYSGLVYPPAFGEPEAVDTLQNMRLFICAITITATLLFAILSLWVSLSTERKRQNTELFFLLCVCIVVFISYFVIHNFLPMNILPWYLLELVSGYIATLLIVLLHNRLCELSPLIQKISGGILGAFCIMIFIYGCLTNHLTQSIADFFTTLIPLFKVGTALYLLATAFWSLYRHKTQINLLFYADVFYAAMLIWDRLLPAYEPVLGGWFQEWGSLALVAALGIILWQDVAMGYRLSLTFHEEHRQMERQIRIQQEHYNQISRQVEESRRMRHDFRQHLRTIAGMADNGTAV
ncbi:MAG: ATP-binding protein, partial [Lachnospiraceae bacterium]|nr:ATP-binding protein [Lachnospiraceae bacterium]